MDTAWQAIGDWRGAVNPLLDSPRLRASLAKIDGLAASPGATLLQAGRHRTVRVTLEGPRGPLDAVVKIFGRQSFPKDLWDRLHGTKAWRTYAAASYLADAGIGTTPPVACLERWRGGTLRASCFVSLYMRDTVCCKDWLVDLWRRRAPYAEFEALMRATARGVRRLHDAGCRHGDLGNQNIFFARRQPSGPYEDAVFIDLNRARFARPLTLAERARDLCRIALPLGFMPAFFRFYWDGDPPAGFVGDWRRFRAPFRLHTATRRFRHPFRELSYRLDPRRAPAQAPYPPAERQWVWDARRFRPAPVLTGRLLLKFLDRRYRAAARRAHERMKASLDVRRGRREAAGAPPAGNAAPPAFRLIVGGFEAGREDDLALLRAAGTNRALVRFSMSDADDLTEAKIRGAQRLAEAGVGIAAVVAQTPRRVREGFAAFAERIASALGGRLDWIAAGQGVNTLSWGIRDGADVRDVVSAGERLVFSRPPKSLDVASSVVEAPVLQLGCGNIAALFGRNVPYCAVALAWTEADGPVADEVRALHALASRTFYARRKILLVSDTPWRVGCPQERELAGLVSEICAPALSGAQGGLR